MPVAARCHSISAWQRRTKAALSLLASAAEMLYEVRQTHFRGNIGKRCSSSTWRRRVPSARKANLDSS
jgi:hypothetical protein